MFADVLQNPTVLFCPLVDVKRQFWFSGVTWQHHRMFPALVPAFLLVFSHIAPDLRVTTNQLLLFITSSVFNCEVLCLFLPELLSLFSDIFTFVMFSLCFSCYNKFQSLGRSPPQISIPDRCGFINQ